MDQKTFQPRYLIQPINCKEIKEKAALYLILDNKHASKNPIKVFKAKPGILTLLYKWFDKHRVSMFNCHLAPPKEVSKKTYKEYLLVASNLE